MKRFMYIFSFIIPITFILIGFIFWKHPPKEMNGVSGWRTEQSMKNQETWNFANLLGAKCTLILGTIEFLCTLIFLFIVLNLDISEVSVVALVIIQSASIAIVYVHVEKELRKHFNQ